MRTRDVERIRHGICYAHSVVNLFRGEDSFTRGMSYRHLQPKNRLSAIAYRRTWFRIEYQRENIPVTIERLRAHARD